MRRYETVFILNPDLSEEQQKPLLDKLTGIVAAGQGKLVKLDQWGQKKLAYEVKKQTRGYYVLMDFCGDGTLVKETERNLRLDDRVLKYMTVLKDESVDLSALEAEMEAAKQEAAKPEPAESEEAAGQETAEPAIQTAGEPSIQPAGEPSTQTAGEPSTQPAGKPSTQTAGEPSTQTAGKPSTQPAGKPGPADQPAGETEQKEDSSPPEESVSIETAPQAEAPAGETQASEKTDETRG